MKHWIHMMCAFGGFLGLPWFALAAPTSLKLLVPAGYLPQIPTLVRVELWNSDGERDRETWDAEATLSVDEAATSLSTNRIRLYNGLGTALIVFDGSDHFNLTARVGDLTATRPVVSLASQPSQSVGGTLSETNTVWSGIVRVTNDVTVPEGYTLTIASNTWVLIDGVVSGPPATDLWVSGVIQSLGTETHPVTITCADPGLHWGQIRHETAQPSHYQHTIITRAGQATGEPHTGTGPAVRATNSVVTFRGCTISDHLASSGRPGKVLQAYRSEVVIDDCVMARSRMGPEVDGTILVCTNSYLMEMMAGIDDEDAIYIHYQGPGRTATLSRCVVVGTTDDGIDTVGSSVTVEDCIVRDIFDKGISIAQGESHGSIVIRNCLIVNCAIGVSVKGVSTVTARIDRSTIRARNMGLAVTTGGSMLYFVTNSIVEATAPNATTIYTYADPANIQIFYSDVLHTNWPGPGNLNADPLFVHTITNFHLQADSPCIDQGDPASPPDPDGSRADMGAFPFLHALPPGLTLSNPHLVSGGAFSFTLTGDAEQVCLIQTSSNLTDWSTVAEVTNHTGQTEWMAPASSLPIGFYRAETVP